MRIYLPAIKLNDEDSVIRFAVASIAFATVTNAINCFVNVFVPNTPVDTAICYLIYLVLLVFALPTILQRFSRKDVYAIFIMIMLFSIAFINPYSSEYAPDIFVRTILEAFPYFILGQAIRDDKKLKESLTQVAPFVISMAILYYAVLLVRGSDLNEDYMSFSYRLLPFSAILLLNILEKPSVKGILFFIVALNVHLLTGTRGPLVCLVFCFILGVFFSNMSKKLRLFLSVVGVIAGVYLLSSLFMARVNALNDIFMNFGVRNRIFLKILSEDFLEGSGRADVASLVWEAIKERPALGYGFLGDRSFQDGGYPHNFVLEMWCHYGIVIGSLLIFLIMFNFIKVFKNRKINRNLYIMLFSASYVKLMMSGTYPMEGMLFFLLGLCVNTRLNGENVKRFDDSEVGEEGGGNGQY